MKKRTVIIVPPRGVPLRSFRIRLSVAIVLGIFSVVGLVGFFLPLNTMTNDVAEQNQKVNLTEQNKALLQKIITTLRMLKDLRFRLDNLEAKREEVVLVTGNRAVAPEQLTDSIDFSKVKTDELLSYVKVIERRFAPFSNISSDGPTVFDSLPVLSPVPEPYQISRKYGVSLDPFSGKQRFHNGTDFIAEPGTPVFCTASGVVSRIEKHALWGDKVVITHPGGFSTAYAHLGEVKTAKGRRVNRGDVIAAIGMSGLSSGPHLHYEIWYKEKNLNPEEYFVPSRLLAAN